MAYVVDEHEAIRSVLFTPHHQGRTLRLVNISKVCWKEQKRTKLYIFWSERRGKRCQLNILIVRDLDI